MHLPRVLPWVPFALLAACEATSPKAASPRATPPNDASSSATEHVASLATSTIDPPAPLTPKTTAAGVGETDTTTPSTAETSTDVHNANAFTLHVLARTKKAADNNNNNNNNVMVSGTSARHALGVTYLGARGTTAREMASALLVENDQKLAALLLRAELTEWQAARGNADLDIASRLWIDEHVAILPDFAKTVVAVFTPLPSTKNTTTNNNAKNGSVAGEQPHVIGVPFAKSEDSRKSINAWVSERTHGKITDLLPPGAVDPKTRAVVTNAIYFKGRWELPFSPSATKDEPFKVDGKKSVNAPAMHLTDTFRFGAIEAGTAGPAQEPGVKVLELRYADSQLAMTIVLPNEAMGLAKVEASLTPEQLDKWTGTLSSTRVNVTLPRFAFRSGSAMGPMLQALGMKTAFTEKADFTGIASTATSTANTERLFLNQVFHQTWISVDEIGTEASAATGTVMRTTSLLTGPVADFRVDHPFLFFIRETKHGRILFAGRVTDPKTTT